MTKEEVLKKYFGYDSFREGQADLIDAILSGRDVLGIMPTGAGKSACYQIPALMLPGITLVISPLISLMTDQVRALNDMGVHAAYINSSLTERQISLALQYAMEGRYKIIYVAPERLETQGFLNFACHADISMVTVDEAHCISQWGQDFRPSYLKIVEFLNHFIDQPVVSAFTATATKRVEEDIISALKLRDPRILVTGFDRANLFFAVRKPKSRNTYVLRYLKDHPADSGIIYCATRKNVDQVTALLRREGIAAARYHAGLDGQERSQAQEDFVCDRIRVIVATNAFGMGIDKSNVRFVLHYNMPQCIENYYQEAGRAGRDGERAECILLYSPQDIVINRLLIENRTTDEAADDQAQFKMEQDEARLQKMVRYCTGSGCLRQYLLQYFGENASACGNCGNCLADRVSRDVTKETEAALSAVQELDGRYGINVVAAALAGDGLPDKLEHLRWRFAWYGSLKSMKTADIKDFLQFLMVEGLVQQATGRYPILMITQEGRAWLTAPDHALTETRLVEEADVTGVKEAKKRQTVSAVKKSRDLDVELNASGRELFELLRTERMEIAKEKHIPPYIVCSDKTLTDLCHKRPLQKDQFLSVYGFGESKVAAYGDRFLAVIRRYIESDLDHMDEY